MSKLMPVLIKNFQLRIAKKMKLSGLVLTKERSVSLTHFQYFSPVLFFPPLLLPILDHGQIAQKQYEVQQ